MNLNIVVNLKHMLLLKLENYKHLDLLMVETLSAMLFPRNSLMN